MLKDEFIRLAAISIFSDSSFRFLLDDSAFKSVILAEELWKVVIDREQNRNMEESPDGEED